jgi:hypothetical protein
VVQIQIFRKSPNPQSKIRFLDIELID